MNISVTSISFLAVCSFVCCLHITRWEGSFSDR